MNAQQLKNSILQLAVQGKLVPQDKDDEPASELLKRIKAEKEKLIKEKKIKPDKNPSEIFRGSDNLPYEKVGDEVKCISDEIPFDIPESWEWVRLGSIGDWGSGATPSRTNSEYYGGNIPWLKTGDLNDDYVSEIPETITEMALQKTSVRLNPIGSVLIAMYGATIGKLGILTLPATTNQACCACLPLIISNKYLFYFLMAHKQEFIKRGEGGAQPNISKEKIINTLMPLPPLSEQQRIVAKIEELMPLVEEYDKVEKQNTQLNISFPDKLKKSILQEAVQGKLVPQDPNDEPASVLIERIRKEKEQLIKDKKIKKDKNESYIFRRDNSYYEKLNGKETCIGDLLPFEIPDSWEWVRLNQIIQLTSGQDLTSDQYNSKQKGIPYITGASNIENGSVKINRWTEFPRAYANRGDLLLTCKGTVGTMAILKENSVHIARQIMGIKPLLDININYINIFLESYINNLKAVAKSMIPGISREIVLSILFPLPPLNEQKRIVDKVNELILNIERLTI